jgi:ComF family protein
MHRLSSVPLAHRVRPWLNLFLSSSCPLCQRSAADTLCPSCSRQLRQSALGQPCDRSQPDLAVVSWGCYEGGLRQAIGHLKYDGRTEIARWLGTELGQTWLNQPTLAASSGAVAILPIPLHPSKQRQRGFNQADLLAQWFCRYTQLPLHCRALVRCQATRAQHSLSRSDRQHNLAQAFAVSPDQIAPLQRTTVWLLDDIFTTGATAQSAAQTLRRSGIAVAGICTVARAMPWAET